MQSSFFNNGQPNNSIEVSAKQPFLKTCVVDITLSVAGFAPRFLKRWAASPDVEQFSLGGFK
jgi:hypothetical protein